MRKQFVTGLILLLSLVGYSQTNPSSVSQPRGSSVFIELDNSLSESIKNGHLAALLKRMANDAAFLNGAGAAGKTKVEQYLSEQYGNSDFILDLKPEEGHVLSEFLGYTTGYYSLSGKYLKCGGCSVLESGKYLLVWRREGREWKVKAWIPSVLSSKGCGCGGGVGSGGGH